MPLSVEEVKEFLNWDELEPLLVTGSSRVSVTLSSSLHQKIMELCGFNKRQRADVIRQLCAAVLYAPAGATLGRNHIIESVRRKRKKKTDEELQFEAIQAGVHSELRDILKKKRKKVEAAILAEGDDKEPFPMGPPPPPPTE